MDSFYYDNIEIVCRINISTLYFPHREDFLSVRFI